MLGKFIDACEDSLTAAVFSHLLHLRSEDFWRILQGACYSNDLPSPCGEPKLIPWPSWNPKGTSNTRRVEPDLLIRFDNFDLIVEAKRDSGMQDSEQWKRELQSYYNEYGEENREVRLLALGGVYRKPLTDPTKCIVHMCRWRGVLIESQRLKRDLEESNRKSPSSRTSADIRILNDLIELFATHSIMALRWFADFDFSSNLLNDSFDSDWQYFRNTSLRFQRL